MTVIAFDGNNLAADKQCDIGGVKFEVAKVRRVTGPDGVALVGFAGSGNRMNQCIAWYEAGADPEKYPKREADDYSAMVCIVRLPDGKPQVRRYEGTGWPLIITNPRYADGAGRDVALAALSLGKNAIEAVRLASTLLSSCGMGVDSITFGDGETFEHATTRLRKAWVDGGIRWKHEQDITVAQMEAEAKERFP